MPLKGNPTGSPFIVHTTFCKLFGFFSLSDENVSFSFGERGERGEREEGERGEKDDGRGREGIKEESLVSNRKPTGSPFIVHITFIELC